MAGAYNQIDAHPDRANIIAELLTKVPILRISAKYGINQHALYRYRKNVVPEKLDQAVKVAHAKEAIRQRREANEALDPFIDTAMRAEKELWSVAKLAREGSVSPKTGLVHRDLRSAVAALNGVIDANEYHARLAGRLDSAPTIQHNTIVIMPSSLAPAPAVAELQAAAPAQLPAAQPNPVIDAEFESIEPADQG